MRIGRELCACMQRARLSCTVARRRGGGKIARDKKQIDLNSTESFRVSAVRMRAEKEKLTLARSILMRIKILRNTPSKCLCGELRMLRRDFSSGSNLEIL